MRRSTYRAACTAFILAGAVLAAPTGATAAPETPPPTAASAAAVPPDRVARPDQTLGDGWRTSDDRAVTTSGDDTGLHVLVADRRDGYRWRTAATLVEPGIDTDQWIGQLCVTGSGRRAVVAYAPRQYSNRGDLMAGGAFAAVVDLTSATVTKLAQTTSLAYYNPGCGAGETAVLSRLAGADTHATTALSVVDTARGAVTRTVRTAGEITSALPVGARILAAAGGAVVQIGTDGRATPVATTSGTPYRLQPDGTDGVAFQLQNGRDTVFERYAGGRLTRVAAAPTGSARLHSAGGTVYLIGPAAAGVRHPAAPNWHTADGVVDADLSSRGLLLAAATTHQEAAAGSIRPGDGTPDPVQIRARLVGGADLTFATRPLSAAPGSGPSPALGVPAATNAPHARTPGAADPSTVASDPDRACAVPRNDPTIQSYQPSPAQVEWAADLAVRGQLTFNRPAGWLNDGLPAYAPQGLFGPVQLAGGGNVPAQVLLGILAQESNLRQASYHVVDGSSGNPLTSPGFYGLSGDNPDPMKIDWSKHDCGYGVGQVTSGMLKTDTNAPGGLSDLQQKAAVTDYATNIAASVQLLEQKWNETRAAGIVANNGDARYIENWFFAVWDYNSGMHAQVPGNPTTPWGLGWLNNPANPIYPADRAPFLTQPLTTPTHHDQIPYDNAKHPSDWAYPERVMGWAATSAILPNYVDGTWGSTYETGYWPPNGFLASQPDRFAFCLPGVNYCDKNVVYKSKDPEYADQPAGPCTRDDLTQCWWHGSRAWVADCANTCGVEQRLYPTVEPRPGATNIHEEQCSVVGLPPNAMIVDDISTTTALGPDGCAPVAPGGQFSLKFGSAAGPNGTTIYPSKVDFHQIGGGFGGHFWFTHTQPKGASGALTVTGTWTPKSRLNGWARVLVHVPDTGAWTQQAHYVVNTGLANRNRYLPTNRQSNSWIELGTYQFGGSGTQNLQLSNVTDDGLGRDDIAWDAAAFVPLSAKPQQFVVAIGDSYESGEGVGGYYPDSDVDFTDFTWDACRRSRNAWPRLTTIPGMSSSIGAMADALDPRLDFQFVACSGAKASTMSSTGPAWYWGDPSMSLADLHADAEGQYGEHAQVDSGVLSADTTLVLLSAGGNDAHFPDWMRTCANGPSCANPADQAAMTSDIDGAQTALTGLIQAVHGAAPHAKILLVGYPKIFASYHTDTCGYLLYDRNEMDLINTMADYMETKQNATVNAQKAAGVNVDYVNMVAGFQDHGACRLYDTIHDVPVPEDINAVVKGPRGPSDYTTIDGEAVQACLAWGAFCVSRASFHPKDTGAVTYASAVDGRLAQIGYH